MRRGGTGFTLMVAATAVLLSAASLLPAVAADLTIRADRPTVPSYKYGKGTVLKVIARQGLNLRSRPDRTASSVALMAYGTSVTVLDRTYDSTYIDGYRGCWLKVRRTFDRTDGWAFAPYLATVAGFSGMPALEDALSQAQPGIAGFLRRDIGDVTKYKVPLIEGIDNIGQPYWYEIILTRYTEDNYILKEGYEEATWQVDFKDIYRQYMSGTRPGERMTLAGRDVLVSDGRFPPGDLKFHEYALFVRDGLFVEGVVGFTDYGSYDSGETVGQNPRYEQDAIYQDFEKVFETIITTLERG